MARNSILIMILTFSIVSCSGLVETYKWTGNRISPDHFELKLNKDSTFIHFGWSDILGNDTTNGHWTFGMDTLFLTINRKSEKPRIFLSEKYDEGLVGNVVKIIESNDSTYLLGSTIYINGDSIGVMMDSSGISYDINNIHNIGVYFLDYDSISVNNSSSNVFEVYLDLTSRKLEYFYISHKWIKRGNKLIQVDENNSLVKNGVFKKSIF